MVEVGSDGNVFHGTTIRLCSNIGSISGNDCVGGIVGFYNTLGSESVNELQSINEGKVSGNTNVGEIIGKIWRSYSAGGSN